MNKRWLLVVVASLVLATVGCASGQPSSSSSPDSSPPSAVSTSITPGLPGTLERLDLNLTWWPAESPSALEMDQLVAYARGKSMFVLLPSAASVVGGASVTVTALSYPSIAGTILSVTVRLDDAAAPLLSLSTFNKPQNELDGAPIDIRGVKGTLELVPNAVSFLQWQEAGQTFRAEFITQDYATMVSWLDEWRTVP
jgi:hypothetical protein